MYATQVKNVLFVSLLEIIIGIIMITITVNLYKIFGNKKKKPSLYLAESFTLLTIGLWINFFGIFFGNLFATSEKAEYYSIVTFAVYYLAIALSNIYIYAFIEIIFLTENKERLFVVSLLEGIAGGLIITRLVLLPAVDNLNPIIMTYHPLLAFFIYGLLFILSIREYRKAKIKKIKYGLVFISLFALFQAIAIVFLTLGVGYYAVKGAINFKLVSIAYLLELFSMIFGYLGYVMPSWIQKAFKINE